MKTKIIFLLSILAFMFQVIVAQDNFDKKLSELSDNLAVKLSDKGKLKIAVWDFTDLDGSVNNLGKYISENLSVYLINSPSGISVVDRNHLNTILKEHQLKSDGFIDPNTAIQLGKIIQVKAIVTGTVTVVRKSLTLTIKALDTETADIIAALTSELPLNNKIKDILEILYNDDTDVNNPSGEGSVKMSKNLKCKENNTGDYCFQNNTKYSLSVYTSFMRRGEYNTIQPGQKQCFYDLQVGVLNYSIYAFKGGQVLNIFSDRDLDYKAKGSVYVETCKQKTFIIK